MRILALGDTHGRSYWKTIIKENIFDKVIFLGDYFDTRENISPTEQIHNFKELLTYKKENPDKVILLFGNHEFHYLRTILETYSGYQRYNRLDIQEIIHEALENDLMQLCYINGNYIFSHAGISKQKKIPLFFS